MRIFFSDSLIVFTEIFNYTVVITECTFLDEESPSEATDKGHTGWTGLRPFVEQHPNITFVLIHFSLRCVSFM